MIIRKLLLVESEYKYIIQMSTLFIILLRRFFKIFKFSLYYVNCQNRSYQKEKK